jgi:plasmid stabilization system protein ParE
MNDGLDAEELPVYALRLSPQAQQDLTEAAFRLVDLTQDQDAGERWGETLYIELGKMATLPRRFAVVGRETRLFGQEIRQMVYRRSESSIAYFIFFSIIENGEEGPTVNVIHIRHSRRKPLSRAEAQQILASQ